MKWFALIIAVLVGCVVAGAAGHAAYLEGEKAAEPVAAPAPPIVRVVPPPRPVPDNPLTRTLRRISVLPGHTYKGLTIWPLEIAEVSDPTDYLSTGEALEEELLVVTEKGDGSVPVLLAENRGGRPILMLAGEIVAGGKQNRILKEDVLLPRRSGKVELPVLCVERGRWSGRGAKFGANPGTAALKVRAGAQMGMAQQEIWNSVSHYQQSFNVDSRTGDLLTVQSSVEVRKAVDEYRAGFRKHWRPAGVGMIVARYGRIVGADIFCNHAVFRKHRDRLLESYAVDCYAWRSESGRRRHVAPDREAAQRFLRRMLRAEYQWRGTPGIGRLLAVQGAGIDGQALVHRDVALHAGLFARDAIIIQPVPMPRVPRIQQQLQMD